MKKVITFSLWGNKPMYTIGAIKNAEDAKTVYPDFECWFYIHEETVPKEIIEKLQTFDNIKIVYKSGDLTNENCKPRMWRFEAIDDPEVEIMMSRDTDTRFTLREQLAVKEWLDSCKLFHIMRDHPHHNFEILGGMFGTKKIPDIPNWSSIMNKYNQNGETRMYDQDFLKDFIYPVIKENSVIHASFYKKEEHAKIFPINYFKNLRFVGEYIYEDGARSKSHIEELKKCL
jgi:hypothetical protein